MAEAVVADGAVGDDFGIDDGGVGFDGGGVLEVECEDGGVHVVAGHIADGSGSEGPPSAPVVGGVFGVVGAGLAWAEPEIPVKPAGTGGVAAGRPK